MPSRAAAGTGGKAIAAETGVSRATVSRVLRCLGLNKLSAPEPAEPVRRYEHENPGELIHIDSKKLGKFSRIGHRITNHRTGQSRMRGIGWEFVHVCIDDASRIAFSQIKADERKRSARAFLKAAVDYCASLGVTVERVMTDKAPAIVPKSSPKPASGSASGISSPDPARPRPTKRPSASSRPACENGPTPRTATLRRTRPRAALLEAPLQLAPTSWQYRRKAAHQPTQSDGEQPLQPPQPKRRLSALLRPGSDFFPGQCGSIFAHWASLRSSDPILLSDRLSRQDGQAGGVAART